MRQLLALLLPLLLLTSLPAQEDLTPQERKLILAGIKANSRDENPLVRAAAIRDTTMLGDVEAAEICVSLLRDEEPYVRNTAVETLSKFSDDEVLEYLAREAARKGAALARAGVIDSLGLCGRPELVTEPLVGYLEDHAPEVKAAVAVALGRLQAEAHLPAILALSGDKDPRVREAVAIAAGDLGSPVAADTLVKLMEDEEWEVRAASYRAAADLKTKPMVSALIRRLAEEEGRLRQDCADALVRITGEDFELDPELWASWWDAHKAEFGITEKIEMRLKDEGSVVVTEYYGIKVVTTRVLFVIDTSNSMNHNATGPRPKEGEKRPRRTYTGTTKMEIAKEELIYVIRDLTESTFFNILTFETEVESWKAGPVRATEANKEKAIKFTEKLRPKSTGATNTYGALMTALGATGKSARAAGARRKDIDTIFFLTDGEPTAGLITHATDILAEVRAANPDARVTIHTVYMGVLGRPDFLQALASENGGEFRQIQ